MSATQRRVVVSCAWTPLRSVAGCLSLLVWLTPAVVLCGCAGGSETVPAGGLTDPVVDVEWSSEAVYSFRFIPSLPGQRGLRFGVFGADVAGDIGCRAYTSEGDRLSGWPHLAISLSGHAEGAYEVTRSPNWDEQPNVAVVTLIVDGDRYEAVGGSVIVQDAPVTEVEAAMGATVVADIRVEFADPPARVLSCQGGFNVATGEMENSTCECEDTSGRQFGCDVDGASSTCCAPGIEDERVVVALAVRAKHCPGLCAFAHPSLAIRCVGLEEQGS